MVPGVNSWSITRWPRGFRTSSFSGRIASKLMRPWHEDGKEGKRERIGREKEGKADHRTHSLASEIFFLPMEYEGNKGNATLST